MWQTSVLLGLLCSADTDDRWHLPEMGSFNFMVIRGIELPCFKDLSHFFLVHPYISKNLVLPVHWCEAAPRRRPLALRKSSYLDGAVPSILHSLRNKPI